MSRTLRTLAALALVALISAGCSNAPAETGTGSRGGTNTAAPVPTVTGSSGGGNSAAPAETVTGNSTGDNSAAMHEQGIKFAECIRENGVSDFPDPDAKGEFAYGVSVSPTVWKKAVDACKDLQPPGSLSTDRSPEQQEAGLKFAQCIRDNGVKDFPDPINGEPLIDTYRIPSSATSAGMTILNAAIQKCRVFGPQPAEGQ